MDWEFSFLYALQDIRTPALDTVMAFLSDLGNNGILWMAIALLLIILPKWRRGGLQMAASMLFCFIVGNLILKNAVGRLRPCQIDTTIDLIVKIPYDSSFPSGHTLHAMTASLSLYFINKKWGIPALVLAVLIAFSRMYNFMHFPTDVLAGAVLGIAGACLMQWIFARKEVQVEQAAIEGHSSEQAD